MQNIYALKFPDANFFELFIAQKTSINLYFFSFSFENFVLVFAAIATILLLAIVKGAMHSEKKVIFTNILVLSMLMMGAMLMLGLKYSDRFNLAKVKSINVKQLSDTELNYLLGDAGSGGGYSCFSNYRVRDTADCNYRLLAEAIIEYEKRLKLKEGSLSK